MKPSIPSQNSAGFRFAQPSLRSLADWLSYLESLHPKSIALGLERVAQVKQRLNLNPDFPIITVGGTNGKGSVCAMLESMLHAAGYRVGCYTSPHLLDYNERVRIAKKPASDAELCTAFEKVEEARKPQLDSRLRGNDDLPEIPLTYFEFGTLAAMQLFIEKQVEVAILEVGLGGRLDAVNVFDSDCAVVVSVDMDHMDYLGDTREKIAYEKAGIFRKGCVAVFGDPDMPAAIASEAQRIGAELWRLGGEFGFDGCSPTPHPSPEGEGPLIPSPLGGGLEKGQMWWNYRSKIGARNSLPYPALRGAYQLNNTSAALAALDALKDRLPVSMEAVRRGLAEVVLPGRFQVLPGRPQIILDVAHNPHAARSLARNLADTPPCRKTIAVFSMLGDKDIAGVARALDGQVDVWLVAGINAPRGLSSAELARVLLDAGVKGAVRTFDTVADALRQACNEAAENDRIAAFGSFYTVAEAMRARGLRYA
ncbi:MAG: bifunctional tetrahydrofolate synthase/dihydrofolate synthase [Nitrosomonadales bacterium]|nr:bifunctional tetrahydrofolate synthase/dihydrofolate synthase [Nitrosomonadales bacterium]